jgi:hypothetical protein
MVGIMAPAGAGISVRPLTQPSPAEGRGLYFAVPGKKPSPLVGEGWVRGTSKKICRRQPAQL